MDILLYEFGSENHVSLHDSDSLTALDHWSAAILQLKDNGELAPYITEHTLEAISHCGVHDVNVLSLRCKYNLYHRRLTTSSQIPGGLVEVCPWAKCGPACSSCS